MEQQMFCYQCQETAGCSGCTRAGVCGKTAVTANLQDLLVYATRKLAKALQELREEKEYRKTGESLEKQKEWNHMICENLFLTITNANFDDGVILERAKETLAEEAGIRGTELKEQTEEEWLALSRQVGVLSVENEDIRSLRELLTYGLKGMAAYVKHANVLGFADDTIDEFLQMALARTLDETITAEELTSLVLETGTYGVKAMAMLDQANTSTYGNPEMTRVNIGVRKNPGILVSGHDLKDLEMLLKQTEGTGVDVYTHSEMLPAHYYPAFKKYSHFAGNYGNAWWKQKEEFESFHRVRSC